MIVQDEMQRELEIITQWQGNTIEILKNLNMNI